MKRCRKTLYLTGPDNKRRKAVIRNYEREDFQGMIEIQKACFPPPFPAELWWNEEQLHNHVTRFPEGALCAEVDGKLAGSITGLIVQMKTVDLDHSWAEVTDNGYIRNHDPGGNTLYIVDIAVHPAYRQMGLGKWLMQTMYETAIMLGLERLVGGGRMAGYHRHADRLSPEQYLDAVVRGELDDPVISFMLRSGRMPAGVARDYLEDEESCNCAAIMVWENPFY